MKKKLLVAVDNIMSFIYAGGIPSTKTATQAKIASEIQKATNNLRHDIKQQDVIISQYQAVLAELNAITGNMKGSGNLMRVVCELQKKANLHPPYALAWEKAPEWASFLLVGDDVMAWAAQFENGAQFIEVDDFMSGRIIVQKLDLSDDHTWSVIANRPAR